MNASFGIDHPLVATYDIQKLRALLIAIGFNMTAVGKHPWGTSTSLAMFDGCLLEIMGIYDASLIDEVPAGDFRFGRHVYEYLQQREGVALTALHSTNVEMDAQKAEKAGLHVAGQLEFGRDVILPDGTNGRTKTTLAMLPDDVFPRLSFFLCQQHRPELIYVPEWLDHPNKVIGISGVNIVATKEHHAKLMARFGALYDGFEVIDGGFKYDTANGVLRIFEPAAFSETVGQLPAVVHAEQTPFIGGMDFEMAVPDTLHSYLKAAGVAFEERHKAFILTVPEATANTVFRFLFNQKCGKEPNSCN